MNSTPFLSVLLLVVIILCIVVLTKARFIIHEARRIIFFAGRIIDIAKKFRSPTIIVTFITNSFKITGDMSKFTFGQNQATASLEIRPIDSNNVEQPYQAGSEKYDSSNPAIFTVEKNAENTKQATITRVGAGLGQLTITVDPDPADEITGILSKSIDIEVPAPQDTDIEVKIDGNVIS